MVFYFTGTGNSLYVAKRLEKNPNAGYRNEHIRLEEIIDANNQGTSITI